MTFLTNKERVRRALDLLEPALAAYVDRTLTNLYQEGAHAKARVYFDEKKREADLPIREWDAHLLLLLMKRSRGDVQWDRVEDSVVCALLELRNRATHQRGDFSDPETKKALEMIDLLHRAIAPPPGPKLLKMFNEQLEEELSDPTWPEVLDRVWNNGCVGQYYGALESGPNLNGPVFRGSPGDRGWEQGVWLYVLPMDHYYREPGRSPAVTLAEEILASMKYRNSGVFLAIDDESVSALQEGVCRLRAWEEVLRNAANLMPHEEEGLRACLDEAERTVVSLLRDAYRWLLVPTQAKPGAQVEWKTIHLEQSQNPLERASKELDGIGDVVNRLASDQLAEVLGRVPLWNAGQHVEIGELAREFARHLHLPRLKNWAVLDKAIAEAVMNPEWSAFAYAVHHDDARGYAGLYFRESGDKPTAGLLKHRVGFLVKPQVIAPALLNER
ncbi:MAG: Swt1 family HEPN domain-containing protein [Planctomycetaceae bacterium]